MSNLLKIQIPAIIWSVSARTLVLNEGSVAWIWSSRCGGGPSMFCVEKRWFNESPPPPPPPQRPTKCPATARLPCCDRTTHLGVRRDFKPPCLFHSSSYFFFLESVCSCTRLCQPWNDPLPLRNQDGIVSSFLFILFIFFTVCHLSRRTSQLLVQYGVNFPASVWTIFKYFCPKIVCVSFTSWSKIALLVNQLNFIYCYQQRYFMDQTFHIYIAECLKLCI